MCGGRRARCRCILPQYSGRVSGPLQRVGAARVRPKRCCRRCCCSHSAREVPRANRQAQVHLSAITRTPSPVRSGKSARRCPHQAPPRPGRPQVPRFLHADRLCGAGDGQRAREERAQRVAEEPGRRHAGRHVLVVGRLCVRVRQVGARHHRVRRGGGRTGQ